MVVDVDDPDLLLELIEMYGDTPVKVRTPRGGTHLYYLAPADPTDPTSVPGDDRGPPVLSRTGVRGPHSYDVKADGQPCHCPGQRHHMLRHLRYEVDVPGGWRGDLDRDGGWRVGELREMLPEFRARVADEDWAAHNPKSETPEHLDEHVLAGTPEERVTGTKYLAAAGPAVSGAGGHDHTRKLILKLGDLGFPEDVGRDLLGEWNRTCEPPWSQRDLDSKIEHYYRRRGMPIGWRAAELEIAEEFTDDTDPAELASDADAYAMLASIVADMTPNAPRVEPPAEAVVPDAVAARGPTAAARYELARRAAFSTRRDGGGRAAVTAAAIAIGDVPATDVNEIIAEVFGADALPHVDVADLFADVPVVGEQCLAAQESLRMSSADVPALFALGFASSALAARCRIAVEPPNFCPPPHLFVVASVPSGRGKSGAVDRMGGVLQRRWQVDVGQEWDEVALAAVVRRDTARSLYSDYQRQAVRLRKTINEGGRKGESLVEASTNLEIVEGHMRKAQLEIQSAHLSKPTWIQADSTPEKFVNLVKEFGFALLVAGEGATILQAFTQGNTGRNRVAALLSAWTGEALDRARVGGQNATVVVDRYAELHACMVLPVQNFLLEPSGEDRERTTILRELAAAGFFARCIVAREEVTGTCEAPVEFDDTWLAMPRVTCARHTAAKVAWDDLLCEVWHSGYRSPPAQPLAPERPDEPHMINLVPEARDHLLRFQTWSAEQTKIGGRWAAERVSESAARIGEQAMRVAAVLAVMRCRTCVGVEVTLAEAERAVRFCKDYAMPLIEHLLERAKPDPIADDADVVRKRIADLQTKHPAGVPKRVLQQRLGRGWGKTDANARVSRVDAALEHLETIAAIVVARNPKGVIMSILIPPPKAKSA